MDPGAKVTFNGVEIGRVARTVNAVDVGGEPRAKIILDVDPKYIELIPKNVERQTSAPPPCSATSTSPSRRRKTRHRPTDHAVLTSIDVTIGDHRVQHPVRDGGVDLS